MAIKAEVTATPAAAAAAAAPATSATPAVPVSKIAALAPWIPVIAAILLAPVLSWVVGEFVLLPRIQKKLAAVKVGEVAEEHAAPAPAAEPKGEAGGKGAK